MLEVIKKFYAISAPAAEKLPENVADKKYKKLRFQAFVAATLGYSLYYVCPTVQQERRDHDENEQTNVGPVPGGCHGIYHASDAGFCDQWAAPDLGGYRKYVCPGHQRIRYLAEQGDPGSRSGGRIGEI